MAIDAWIMGSCMIDPWDTFPMQSYRGSWIRTGPP